MPKLDPVLSLAFAVFLLFSGMLVILSFHEAPQANQTLLNALLGVLAAAFTGIMGFYFGSSTASKTKDATIANLAAPADPAPIVPAA